MSRGHRSKIAATTVVVAALVGVGVIVIQKRQQQPPSWQPGAEGLLAVADVDTARSNRIRVVPEDESQVQPATAAEAAEWLNSWPYHAQGERLAEDEAPLRVGAQSAEVRCSGPPKEPAIVPDGDDVGTITAIQRRRDCEYVKWKAWTGETANVRDNERHTVWVDDAGRFRGRVDYWR